MTKPELVQLAEAQINSMWGIGGYYPRRIKPKWDSTEGIENRFDLFLYYISQKRPSIGSKKLVSNGFPEYTLDALLFKHPNTMQLISNSVRENCAEKFSMYPSGRSFLRKNWHQKTTSS